MKTGLQDFTRIHKVNNSMVKTMQNYVFMRRSDENLQMNFVSISLVSLNALHYKLSLWSVFPLEIYELSRSVHKKNKNIAENIRC